MIHFEVEQIPVLHLFISVNLYSFSKTVLSF